MVSHMERGETTYFEDVDLGASSSVTDARTLTEADVVNFAGITGDFGDIHVSKPVARESEFGRRLVMGNLVHAIAEPLGIDWTMDAFSYGHDRIRFVNPVFIDDTISVRREVVEREDYDERYGRVVNRYEVTNQHEETVLVDDHVLMVAKRDGG